MVATTCQKNMLRKHLGVMPRSESRRGRDPNGQRKFGHLAAWVTASPIPREEMAQPAAWGRGLKLLPVVFGGSPADYCKSRGAPPPASGSTVNFAGGAPLGCTEGYRCKS